MSDLVYTNGANFVIGASVGFGLSNSFRMLEDADKMPGDVDYRDAYPVGIAALTETVDNYIGIESGETIFEALSDDPGFMAGTAMGVYLGERYFETVVQTSELEELYRENDLDEVWEDLEY